MADNEIDKELAEGIKLAKKTAASFILVAQGSKVVKLLVRKRPFLAGDVTSAKKEFGGNVAVMGVVEPGTDNDLVFKPEEEVSIGDIKLRAYIIDATKIANKATIKFEPAGAAKPAASEKASATPSEEPPPDPQEKKKLEAIAMTAKKAQETIVTLDKQLDDPEKILDTLDQRIEEMTRSHEESQRENDALMKELAALLKR